MSTPKLVFDIETAGIDFEALDDLSQEYMLKYAQSDDEEKEIKESLAFYPLTGEVVAIGALNPDTGKAQILCQNKGIKGKQVNEIDENCQLFWGTEKEIIEKFWELVNSYKTFVSFNGRGFDVPYLMIRSAMLGIRPSKNLMANRYTSYQSNQALHIDLADQLSFYGAVRRKFSLHMYTKAFGISSPKEEGVKGEDVTKMFNEGEIFEIARYNLRDLIATTELYKYWDTYINL